MTKTKLGQSDVKQTEFTSAPLYTAVHVTDGEQQQREVSNSVCSFAPSVVVSSLLV